jgi:hypothetical protein
MPRLILVFAAVATLFLCPLTRATETSGGEVEKVDAKHNNLVLSAECECGSGRIIEMTFTLKDSTKVLLNGKDAKLSDIKHGDRVEVDYNDFDDVAKVTATRDG